MRKSKRYRSRARWLVTVTVSTIVMSGASASPAFAQKPGWIHWCPPDHVCLWVDTYYRMGPDSIIKTAIHKSELYDCKAVRVQDNFYSSAVNNTKYKFQLWNLWGKNSKRLIGTAQPYSSYGYFGRLGNDTLDHIDSPGCGIE